MRERLGGIEAIDALLEIGGDEEMSQGCCMLRVKSIVALHLLSSSKNWPKMRPLSNAYVAEFFDKIWTAVGETPRSEFAAAPSIPCARVSL